MLALDKDMKAGQSATSRGRDGSMSARSRVSKASHSARHRKKQVLLKKNPEKKEGANFPKNKIKIVINGDQNQYLKQPSKYPTVFHQLTFFHLN